MRCLLTTSEYSSDKVPEALDLAGIDYIRSRDLRSDWLTTEVSGIDFVLAVLDGTGNDEPPTIYLEIGVALGRDIPILIISAPHRSIPLAIAGLRRVEVDLQNINAISDHLRQFRFTLRPTSPLERWRSQPDPILAASLRARLQSITSEDYQQSPQRVSHSFESLVRDMFSSPMSEASSPAGNDKYDLAAWVNGVSEVLGGPILIECKIGPKLRPGSFERLADRLADVMYTRSINLGLIVYHDLRDPRHVVSSRISLPVFAVSAEEVIDMIGKGSLGESLIALRNELIHRAG